MKKISLIFSFVVFFVFCGNAQNEGFRFGVKLGPSIDWASAGSTAVHNEGVGLGFKAGVVLDYHISSAIALSSGLDVNFLKMRYQFTDSRMVANYLQEAPVLVSRRVNATAIEVPIKAKFGYEFMDSFRAYVETGAGLGFNLVDNCKDAYSFFGVLYEDQRYADHSDQYKTLQLSLVFGIGAEYQVNRKLSLFAQLTIDHGVLNAFTRSLERKTESVIRNNFIGIEVGVLH